MVSLVGLGEDFIMKASLKVGTKNLPSGEKGSKKRELQVEAQGVLARCGISGKDTHSN